MHPGKAENRVYNATVFIPFIWGFVHLSPLYYEKYKTNWFRNTVKNDKYEIIIIIIMFCIETPMTRAIDIGSYKCSNSYQLNVTHQNIFEHLQSSLPCVAGYVETRYRQIFKQIYID